MGGHRNVPPPSGLFNDTNGDTWYDHADIIANVSCVGEPAGEILDVCACSIPWESLDMANPNCGCGYNMGSSDLSVQSICFTGGKTMLVFFSILIGGFGMGQAGPGVQALST